MLVATHERRKGHRFTKYSIPTIHDGERHCSNFRINYLASASRVSLFLFPPSLFSFFQFNGDTLYRVLIARYANATIFRLVKPVAIHATC